jgi:hypothetical protein
MVGRLGARESPDRLRRRPRSGRGRTLGDRCPRHPLPAIPHVEMPVLVRAHPHGTACRRIVAAPPRQPRRRRFGGGRASVPTAGASPPRPTAPSQSGKSPAEPLSGGRPGFLSPCHPSPSARTDNGLPSGARTGQFACGRSDRGSLSRRSSPTTTRPAGRWRLTPPERASSPATPTGDCASGTRGHSARRCSWTWAAASPTGLRSRLYVRNRVVGRIDRVRESAGEAGRGQEEMTAWRRVLLETQWYIQLYLMILLAI